MGAGCGRGEAAGGGTSAASTAAARSASIEAIACVRCARCGWSPLASARRDVSRYTSALDGCTRNVPPHPPAWPLAAEYAVVPVADVSTVPVDAHDRAESGRAALQLNELRRADGAPAVAGREVGARADAGRVGHCEVY